VTLVDETEIRTLLEERLNELSERLEGIDEDLLEHEEADFLDRAIETAGDEVLEGLGSAGQREIQQIRAPPWCASTRALMEPVRAVNSRLASVAFKRFPTRHFASYVRNRTDWRTCGF
jgi:hypothetical protein